MPRPAEEIVADFYRRRNERAPELNTAQRVKDAFNGDIALPVTELHGRGEKAGVANLLRQGINQGATRAGSTLPTLFCPPTRPGVKKAEAEADARRRAMTGWWQVNDFKTKQYRRLRHFIAYASSPVMLRPDFVRRVPCWYVCDPLSTFPAPSAGLDDMEPADCIFTYRRSLSWLRARYNVAGVDGANRAQPDDLFDVLEYVSDEEHVMIVLGRSAQLAALWTPTGDYQGERFRELLRTPNLAGVCTAVVPGRVTLDRPQGQFDGMLSMFIRRARLEALSDIAVEKGVFENEWFVESPGQQGEIVTYADGREGVIGWVRGGEMKWHSQNPGYKTDTALDRMERQERIEGPIPAEFGAESASNVRTDRRGNTILGVAIDPSMQETHDLFAESYRKELHRAAAIDKAYFGDEDKSFYVSWKGAKGRVDYVPNRIFADTDEVEVRWSMPGSNINDLVIGGGQRVGMGTLSKRGFMELDPLIDDVEQEHDRVILDQLEQGILEEFRTPGSAPLPDKAKVMQWVGSNEKELAEAILAAQEEAQQRQATSGEPGTPAGPVAPGSPEAQPGIVPPGMGAEAGSVPGPTQGQTGLASLLSALRGPQRTLPSERVA